MLDPLKSLVLQGAQSLACRGLISGSVFLSQGEGLANALQFIQIFPTVPSPAAYDRALSWLTRGGARIEEANPPVHLRALHGSPSSPNPWGPEAYKTLILDLEAAGAGVRVRVLVLPLPTLAAGLAEHQAEAQREWGRLLDGLWTTIGVPSPGLPQSMVRDRMAAQGIIKVGAGVAVFFIGLVTLVLQLPILWFGGLIFGGLLIYAGFKEMRHARQVLASIPPLFSRPSAPDFASPAQGIRCAACGLTNPADARFCGGCGRPLGAQGS